MQLFHLTNQAESRASKSIAALTADLTRKTQQDSASMITIAAVTMFFLPGTFIAVRDPAFFFSFYIRKDARMLRHCRLVIHEFGLLQF